MKVNVQAPNLTVSEELMEFMEKKLSKLELFYDRIIYADVFLKNLPGSEKNKSVEVLLSVPGDEIIAKKVAKSFEEAIDENIKALEKQLKRRKEKQNTHL